MKRPRIRAGGFYFSRGFAARSRALRARISRLRRSCARLDKTAMPRRLGLPGLIDRVTRLGGSPHLLYKRDQIKMRDYMNWRATPPKRFTSPTWCPPPPLKKALKRETSRNSLVTRFMEEMSVFLFTLVFHCRSFSPWWKLAFLIFSAPL